MASDDARALIDGFRRATAATEALRERNRQGIARRLARGDEIGLPEHAAERPDLAPPPRAARWPWIGVVAACAAALVTVWLLGGADRWRADPWQRQTPSSALDRHGDREQHEIMESPPAIAPALAPAIEPAPVELAPPVPVRPRRRADPVAPASPEIEPADVLAAELAAITSTRAALARGDASTALARALDYQRRFADGSLAEEGWSLRLQALCRLDRTDEAAAVARAFADAFPRSDAATAARARACRENP